VHLPEFTLRSGRFSSFCGVLSVWMMYAQREMAVDVSEPITQSLLELHNNRMRLKAVGAFVISVLYERDRRIQGALAVIPITHRE